MKILLITSPSRGGAGHVSYNLTSQLETLGHDVMVLSRFPDSLKSVEVLEGKKSIASRIAKRARKNLFRVESKYHFFDGAEYKQSEFSNNLASALPEKVDLIIVSFYQNFLNFRDFDFLRIKFNAPFVFWMMDMAVFTGGCHYAWDCKGYMLACGNCPALSLSWNGDLSMKNLEYKRQVLANMSVSAIAISKYQKEQALRSSLLKQKAVYLMYHSVDLENFKPVRNNVNVKNELGLSNEFTLFFVSSNIDEYRKGFKQLYEALGIVDSKTSKKLNVMVCGSYKKDYLSLDFENIKLIRTGNETDQAKLISYYQASSFTVVPTLQDSGPLTVMESLACGTPVITYNMGIGADVVKTGFTGFVSEVGNVQQLAENIMQALGATETQYSQMRERARQVAEQNFSQERQLTTLSAILKKAKAND